MSKIDGTEFGNITINGKTYEYDVVINLKGEVSKRKKKLSKEKFGTSHKISKQEAKHIFEEGANNLIIGTGQTGFVELSDEAARFLDQKKCQVELLSTPAAIEKWNQAGEGTIGLFHVTC
ncbi:MAG: Mth938-like domain-containing protein [Bacteroidota bacterium]